ncbi:MAG: hypothetical protein COX40_01805 [Candidatus Omnitrophica bacterium CG23_combo_of_CG06-09_8_20_14_all_40_11]|nr:MAG: hypothetical protein COX40_01805 [Candidatus Omnitrophica bacterium CG23_combo_of_CG06-09_8_20_14_all_40_11]
MGRINKHQAVNPVRNLFLPFRKNDISNGVKLVIGFIFQDESALNKAKAILKSRFGKIDFESQTLAFTHTNYYEAEFGKNLKRKFISFQKLILPQNLPKIKINTNIIEEKLSKHGLRIINIDPGYLDMAKLILASTKDYKHRIYLDKGIYAEITLFYQNKNFTPWEWTYPDYKSSDYIAIFNHIRALYAEQIKNKLR